MPDKCEVISDKYPNMRYSDKSSTDLELEDFLVKAYKKHQGAEFFHRNGS